MTCGIYWVTDVQLHEILAIVCSCGIIFFQEDIDWSKKHYNLRDPITISWKNIFLSMHFTSMICLNSSRPSYEYVGQKSRSSMF